MNVYFSGIGGVGLGPLAQMSIDAGFIVFGSDTAHSLTTDELKNQGVQMCIGEQTSEYLREVHATTPIDWFVHTAALPPDHPELTAARALGITVSKRDGLLAHIIEASGQQLIAIAGTHGKTTTTGMMVWMLQRSGIPISYSIGSQISFGPSGKFDSNADYFVYECDEFDRNFLQFAPTLSIVTSIDYDHPDTYPTESEYKDAFRQFVNQSKASILWQHDADYIHVHNEDAWCLQPYELKDLAIAGEHNRRNGTLVLKAMERLELGDRQVYEQLFASFPGTIRRFENLADNVYSDYGHHPVEIAATLQMAKELNRHVVLVYQPHQNVRQHEIINQYTSSVFNDADEVYWLPTYLSREDPDLETLTPQQLTAQLSDTKVHIVDFDDVLWDAVTYHRDQGHLVLFMGAGSIDGWVRKKLSGTRV
jgi:UDP-N-acetylmuramate--alanine ligase